ncbi:MAG: transcriptional regulator, partial [Oscillospiraceae bacterium]|nr:transcriptional regulator [Oscillospiraceae bacterium]
MCVIEETVAALTELMMGGYRDVMEPLTRRAKGEQFILTHLYEKSGAALPSELSKALHSSTARVSAVLGALEKKGQIRRDIDTSNRRNILVTLTDTGCTRICSATKQMKACLTHIFTEMGERDALEFVRLNKRFLEIAQRAM